MELTNHTYLRSRVDMHIADSLRQKASSKIAAGGITDARDNAGGFSAAVRMKSNQYLLQSKRANIQNSLSYLQAQKDAIENARELVEKIALVKLKFDSPTLNASDKAHLNKEFMELTEEMIQIKQQSFNGISLFATKVDGSDALYNGVRAELATGADQSGSAQITKHVIDHEDIRNIYVAGEAVKRGIGGLDIVNFESTGVQEQKEVITITGNIADGDEFTFKINELSQIRELEKEHTVFVKAGAPGYFHPDHSTDRKANGASEVENASNPHTVIADLIVQEVNSLVSDQDLFVKAERLGTNQVVITAEGRGDPFELYDVRSLETETLLSKTESNFTQENAGEIRNLKLDFKHNSGGGGIDGATNNLNTGTLLKEDDVLSVVLTRVDPNTNEPIVPADTITIATDPLTLGEANQYTDPLTQYDDAAQFLLGKLRTKINLARDAGDINVTADPPTTDAVGANMLLKSTVRGQSMGTPVLTRTNVTGLRAEQAATGSEVDIFFSREAKAGDVIRIQKWVDGSDPINPDGAGSNNYQDFTFTQGTDFTTLADLKTAIQALEIGGAKVFTVNESGTIGNGANPKSFKLIDQLPNNIETQRAIRVSQTQTNDPGSVLGLSTTDKLFTAKSSNPNVATNGAGDGNLKISLNIGTDGTITAPTVTTKGLTYNVGDTFTAGVNNSLADEIGKQINFRVDSLEGEVKTMNATASSGNANNAARNYSDIVTTGAGTTGSGFQVSVTSDINGDITSVDAGTSGGSGYDATDVGRVVTISAADMGGNDATDATVTIDGVLAGEVTSFSWNNNGSAASTGFSKIYDGGPNDGSGSGVTTSGGSGSGLKLKVTTGANGAITGVSVADAGSGYLKDEEVTVLAAALGGGNAADATFKINTLEGKVKTVSQVGTEKAKTSWSFSNSTDGGDGNFLSFTGTAGRDGVITLTLPPDDTNNGMGYTPSTRNMDLDVTLATGTETVTKSIQITSVETAWADKSSNIPAENGDGVDSTGTDDSAYSTDISAMQLQSAASQIGDQYIPVASDTNVQFTQSVSTPNATGSTKTATVQFISDSGLGEIPKGVIFTMTVTEVLHTNENNGLLTESLAGNDSEGNRTGAEHEIVATYTTGANDTEQMIREGLRDDYNTKRLQFLDDNGDNVLSSSDPIGLRRQFDLPEITADSGNTLTFTGKSDGEDFTISVATTAHPDLIGATGGLDDPRGILSRPSPAQKNISPFSITQALEFFQNMLSQNAAETSRLMKAQEHLENSIVNTEQAWGKLNDTDYAKASTEQVRESMKVQMANNIIGKSIRMNDLLIDLTTKHHRGAILNARA